MFHCNMDDIPILGLLGMVSHRAKNTAKDMYQEFDMNRSSAGVLFMLHKRKTMSQKELAKRLNVTAPSITSMIQKMEKSGYIVRNVDEKDQRMMRLDLTEKGQACIEHVKAITEKMDEIAFTGISPEEKMLLRRILFQICENVEKERNR